MGNISLVKLGAVKKKAFCEKIFCEGLFFNFKYSNSTQAGHHDRALQREYQASAMKLYFLKTSRQLQLLSNDNQSAQVWSSHAYSG